MKEFLDYVASWEMGWALAILRTLEFEMNGMRRRLVVASGGAR